MRMGSVKGIIVGSFHAVSVRVSVKGITVVSFHAVSGRVHCTLYCVHGLSWKV